MLTDHRIEPVAPSDAARRLLGRWTLPASFAFHAAVVALFLLLAYWSFAPAPEETPIRVTVVDIGPGSSGASGGNGGKAPSATDASTSAPSPAASAPTPTPSVPPPTQPAPTAAAPQVAPEAAAATLPEPPRRKPTPPHPTPQRTAEPPQTIAAAPRAAGAGDGTGGSSGAGAGATGSGHGIAGTHAGPGDDYLERVRRWLAKYKQYPDAAKEMKQEGQVVVSFAILRDGTVLDPRIERGSGFPLLDTAAIAMLQRASPVPPPPTDPEGHGRVEMPVTYSLALLDKVF